MQLGQSRTLPVEKSEQIDLAQAARYFGARGEADTATMALLQRCAVPLLAAATPRAVWLRAEVKALTEAGILRGGDVMRHLEEALACCPVSFVTKAAPPFLIIHGEDDHTVPFGQGEELHDELEKAGCDVTLLSIEDADHADLHFFQKEVWDEICAFFRAKL